MERLIYSSPFFRSHFSFCHFTPILNKKTYFRISNKNLVPEVTKSKSYQKKNIYIYIPTKKKQRTWIVNENPLWAIFHDFSSPLVQLLLRQKNHSDQKNTSQCKQLSSQRIRIRISSFPRKFFKEKKKKRKRSKISNDDGYLHTIRSFAIICWIRNNFLRS